MWEHCPERLIRLNHGSGDAPRRGIEPHGFAEDHLLVPEAAIVLGCRRTIPDNPLQFAFETSGDFRVLSEQIKGPRQGDRRGLVSGEDQRDTFVANLFIGHANAVAAGLSVFGGQQHRKQISAILARSSPLLDEAIDDAIDPLASFLHA